MLGFWLDVINGVLKDLAVGLLEPLVSEFLSQLREWIFGNWR